jgi:hypothetical protein
MEVNFVIVVYKCHLSEKVGAVCVQKMQVQLPKPRLLLQHHSLLPTTIRAERQWQVTGGLGTAHMGMFMHSLMESSNRIEPNHYS